jgi:hypothetical protein
MTLLPFRRFGVKAQIGGCFVIDVVPNFHIASSSTREWEEFPFVSLAAAAAD